MSQDAFLNKLTELIRSSKDAARPGSLFVTMKRYDAADELDRAEEAGDAAAAAAAPRRKKSRAREEFVCLIRAKLGSVKISTLVPYKDHVRFQQQFALVMKVHADGLKKREKRKGGAAAEARKKARSPKRG